MPAKKKTKDLDKTRRIMVGLLAVGGGLLALGALVFVFMYPMRSSSVADDGTPKGSIVSLGALEYEITDGKAVKRTDEHLAGLRAFLLAEGEKSVGANCPTVYHEVMAASPDEKQVLLGYGCDQPGARMFAVQTDGQWELLSPTNQFDLLGIPSCEHVDGNGIDSSIAPVCVDFGEDEATNSYRVRV